jgi:exopolyphosphatase / guanosine-5'-triphosphate,3'-diphosphate pyrophosphatase
MLKSARHAIVDIGSNSIRLVVFSGSKRSPTVLYDDKVVAGLGRGVVARGAMDRRGMSLALSALKRFAALIRLVDPGSLQVVATAAVRDAANGAQFLEQVRALGLPVRLLSGEDEARASAWGVVASHPGAHGLVADLGGGSLELARIEADKVFECASFPLGIMPIEAIRAGGRGQLRGALNAYAAPLGWLEAVRGDQLFLVGGAWRALDKARVQLFGGELGVAFAAADARQLKTAMRELGPRRLAAIPGVSSSRALQLGHASAMLWALVAEIGPREVVVSNAGLREGLLFKGH